MTNGVGEGRRTPLVITIFFVVLTIVLEGSLALYWMRSLEPRLREEAQSQASVLAQSQAALLTAALAAAPDQRDRALTAALDQLLLLRDPASEQPYFDAIQVEVDHDALDAAPGTLDRTAGPGVSDASMSFEVPLFDRDTDELVGIASFAVNPGFYRAFNEDVRRQFIVQAVIMLGLLLVSWIALLVFLRLLERARLRREQAERALAAHEQKFRRLLDNLDHYFVYGRDAQGWLTYVSDSAARVLPGISPDRLIAEPASLLTYDPVNDTARGLIGAPPAPTPKTYEVEVCDAAGGLHRLELSEIPTFDEHGGVSGVDGIARDVTEDRRLETELRQARDAAESANLAKSQFLANMSHEIRTPMNAVLGMVTLLERTSLDQRQQDLLRQARASAQVLLGVINDILDLSRIEAGKLPFERRDFRLDDVLSDLAAVVGERARIKQIEVLFDVDTQVPPVLRGDAMRLQQVLLNLVSNAIKFTASGEIVVAVRSLESTATMERLELSVSDTGCGIAPHDLDRLFQPFTQVDESNTRRHGGAGLGLAICRRLVEAMDGTIRGESTPGAGSRFTFDVRLEPARDGDTPTVSSELAGLRVLVADDNATARRVFKGMLDSLRFRTEVVGDGQAAVTRVLDAEQQDRPYGLVLMDWKMPALDGLEAARQIRQQATQPPPIVLVTAYGGEEMLALGSEAAVDLYLQKPVSPSTLFDAVVSALGHAPRGGAAEPGLIEPGRGFAPGQRVLLAEDNEINRQVALELLQDLGVEVLTVTNGRQAVDAVRNMPLDLVLMDIQMPEMDGLAATRVLKSDPALRHIPIVALTAHAMIGDRQRFLAAGMDDYLSKPIEERTLNAVLARWLKPATAAPRASGGAGAAELPILPGIDVAGALARVSGKRDLLQRLLRQLQGRLDADLARIRAAVEEGRLEDARTAVHTLKGAAATLGASGIADAALALEQALRRSEPAEPALVRLAQEMEQIRSLDLSPLEPPSAPGPTEGGTVPDEALNQLAAALAENSFDAVTLFESLKPALSRHGDREAVDALEAAITTLDFDTARQWARRLLDGSSAAREALRDRSGKTLQERSPDHDGP